MHGNDVVHRDVDRAGPPRHRRPPEVLRRARLDDGHPTPVNGHHLAPDKDVKAETIIIMYQGRRTEKEGEKGDRQHVVAGGEFSHI